tara:strand:+ start:113 stop:496 length:384 start_codon:yes stop_codon:yes gene_type:complete
MIEFVKDANNSMFIEKSRISNINKEATTITIYTNGLLEISDKITITVTAGYEDTVADKLIEIIKDNTLPITSNVISTDYIFSVTKSTAWRGSDEYSDDVSAQLKADFPDGIKYVENKWITAITYTGT